MWWWWWWWWWLWGHFHRMAKISKLLIQISVIDIKGHHITSQRGHHIKSLWIIPLGLYDDQRRHQVWLALPTRWVFLTARLGNSPHVLCLAISEPASSLPRVQRKSDGSVSYTPAPQPQVSYVFICWHRETVYILYFIFQSKGLTSAVTLKRKPWPGQSCIN